MWMNSSTYNASVSAWWHQILAAWYVVTYRKTRDADLSHLSIITIYQRIISKFIRYEIIILSELGQRRWALKLDLHNLRGCFNMVNFHKTWFVRCRIVKLFRLVTNSLCKVRVHLEMIFGISNLRGISAYCCSVTRFGQGEKLFLHFWD